MGIFSKKPPCPICGGKISWFLPSKIEGEYICDSCYGKLDMQQELATELTMEKFREYLGFYEQNRILKEQFVVSKKVNFGLLDTKIVFDFENRMFCMSSDLSKTIFQGASLKSFTIKEDNTPLFTGSAKGLMCYQSTVPERVMALVPQITQLMMNRRLAETIDKLNDTKEGERSRPVQNRYTDIPEPFRTFNVELIVEHPYWKLITCDMSGPRFRNQEPDVNDYMREYEQDVEQMRELARAFMQIAFPSYKEITVSSGSTTTQNISSTGDSIEEIKKFKALMDEGIITKEEFEAKKKQIMGI